MLGYPENIFDTLSGHVKKVVDISRNVNYWGNRKKQRKKWDVLVRCEKMRIIEGYWHFQ